MSQPARGGRIEALDGYRAIAAIGVLMFHIGIDTGFVSAHQPGGRLVANLGNWGVAVFFLLSGFVISRPFCSWTLDGSARPETAPFFIRRALRIFPAYWLALIAWAMSETPERRAAGGGTVWGKILLIDPYDPKVPFLTGLGVAWTLTIEISFYVFVPIYAVAVHLLARRASSPTRRLQIHLAALVPLFIAPYLYRLYLDHTHGIRFVEWNYLPDFLDWFGFGMLLAVLSVWATHHRLPTALVDFASRTWACWTCAAVTYAAIVIVRGDTVSFGGYESTGQKVWRLTFQGVSAFFLLLPAIVGRPDQPAMRWLRRPTMVFLGTISYGIYLWHTIVLIWLRGSFPELHTRARFIVTVLAVLIITVAIASISYYGVERPMIRLYPNKTRSPRLSPDGNSP